MDGRSTEVCVVTAVLNTLSKYTCLHSFPPPPPKYLLSTYHGAEERWPVNKEIEHVKFNSLVFENDYWRVSRFEYWYSELIQLPFNIKANCKKLFYK